MVRRSIFLAFAMLSSLSFWAQETLDTDTRHQIEQRLNEEITNQRLSIGKAHVDSVFIDGKRVQLFMNDAVGYIPFREENVQQMYTDVGNLLPSELQKRKLELWTNGRLFEQHIPRFTRTHKVKDLTWTPRAAAPIVRPVDRPFTPTAGLQDRHIAMWQSHGYYYEQKLNRWEWQRARIFETVEDLYTQSYVLPFLVPMLENAGAYVMLPRERDFHTKEMILDNDGDVVKPRDSYSEKNGKQTWEQGQEKGFAHRKAVYTGFDNPFQDGTYRQTTTIKKGEPSQAIWTPDIDKTGEYAVYVSYKSLPNSTTDALYTIHHLGGETSFRVNQQMGGGTWIYLGTFPFSRGQSGYVQLTNQSSKEGRVLTADAVKVGGGMGNVARYLDAEDCPNFQPDTLLSGYPRFTEGARYWMQWAGVPDSVYSPFHGKNDYKDDYMCRGEWVNWLAGGSDALPNREGLHIPVDMSFAFHTDAGTTLDDRIVGTLLIYETVTEGRDTYANGASRYLAEELADLIQTQIVKDVRTLAEPDWHRRGKWNSSYYEARVPEVPACLLELLSHQNFADMRYGLDPRFRFMVCRAVYKGILQFISSQRGTRYVVQPLPVDHFSVQIADDKTARLNWQPVLDSLESTATPDRYVVYSRIDNGGWDNGVLVNEPTYTAQMQPGHLYSWKVKAVNDGGCSFDSEILSAGIAENPSSDRPALVINGFDRISAPADFEAPGEASTQLAGFLDDYDHGVPYLRDISYIGAMKEFRRSIPWMDDDAAGFGDSYGDHETQVIAGNTFDYPSIHGAALLQNGVSFVSCSNESVESGQVSLSGYPMVDLILGKQCQTKMGNGKHFPLRYKTFSDDMQECVKNYLHQGGSLFTSGMYVATDLWDNPISPAREADKIFTTDVLKFKWRVHQAAHYGGLKTVQSALSQSGKRFNYYKNLNANRYVVEAPDALEPADNSSAQTVMRYTENNLSAAVAYRGDDYRVYTMGVPFECITDSDKRQAMMHDILQVLMR